MDSTGLGSLQEPEIHSHRVFAELAERGKTSTGWFFGFKLHLVFNDRGELLNLMLTPGNTDDRQPVPKMVRKLFGKLFAEIEATFPKNWWTNCCGLSMFN